MKNFSLLESDFGGSTLQRALILVLKNTGLDGVKAILRLKESISRASRWTNFASGNAVEKAI